MQGEKVRLRAIELDDIDVLYEMENDVDNWAVSDTQMPFSRYTMEQYVLSCGNQDIYTLKQLRLMICAVTGGEVLGCIDLFDFCPIHQRAAVGVLIRPEYRKKGYATEALQLLIRYAAGTLRLKQLYCQVDAGNLPSLRLFEKQGFVRTGTYRSWHKTSAREWEDEYLLQRILF